MRKFPSQKYQGSKYRSHSRLFESFVLESMHQRVLHPEFVNLLDFSFLRNLPIFILIVPSDCCLSGNLSHFGPASTPIGRGAMEDVVFNQLNALDDSTLGVIITDLLRDKPELAPALVTQAIPDLTFAPTKSLTDKGARCSGTIKSVTSELGHGLIDCPQLNSVFGCDVVVFPPQVGSFKEGQSVNFAVTLNDDSKPQAFDLIEEDTKKDMMTSMGGSMGGMSGMGMGMGGFMPGFGMGMMMNGNAGNAAVAKSAARPPNVEDSGDPGEEELGVFVGRFKVWNAEKGFGYIQCDALLDEGYSGEVVLHQHQRKNFQPGQDVSFTCVLRNGQLQAQELEHPRMATGRPMSFGEGMPPGKRYRSS